MSFKCGQYGDDGFEDFQAHGIRVTVRSGFGQGRGGGGAAFFRPFLWAPLDPPIQFSAVWTAQKRVQCATNKLPPPTGVGWRVREKGPVSPLDCPS